MRAHKRGRKPQISEKIGQKIILKNRSFSGTIGAFLGPHSKGEEPKLARKGPLWPDWRLLGQAPVY